MCYSATQNRKVKTYVTLFQALKDATSALGIPLAPSSHMIDFEVAAATASKTVFTKTNVTFCHFYYAKAIWRTIEKKSMFNQSYIQDSIYHVYDNDYFLRFDCPSTRKQH